MGKTETALLQPLLLIGNEGATTSPYDNEIMQAAALLENQTATARKVFPHLFSRRFSEERAVDPICAEKMRELISRALALTEIDSAKKIENLKAEFLKEEEATIEEEYRAADFWKDCGYSEYEIEGFLESSRKRGKFERQAYRSFVLGQDIAIYDTADDTLARALCAAHARLETRLFEKQKSYFSRAITQADFMGLYAMLQGAMLVKQIDYPQCAKQKGGREKIESSEAFRLTIADALKAEGGLDKWKRLSVDDQLFAIVKASQKYRNNGKRLSFSSAKVWKDRAAKVGLFEAEKAETES